jgi:hypothetical protein
MEEYIEVKRNIIPKCFSELNISVYNLPQKKKEILTLSNLPKWKINKNDPEIGNESENKFLKRNEGFYILANKVNISKHLKKTKFCNIFIQEGTCNRKICNFAHSIDEYNFPSCAFGNNCKIDNCKFKHPCETIEHYKSRVNFKVPQNIK